MPVPGRQRVSRDVQQFHAVTDGDAGDTAALGRHDDRDPVERDSPGVSSHRTGLAQGGQFSEGSGIAGAAHLGGQVAGCRRASQQPADPGPDHIGADQHQQASADVSQAASAGSQAAFPPVPDQVPPVRRGFGSAGQPPVLPAAARLGFQPVHHRDQAKAPALLADRIVPARTEGPAPGEDLLAGGPGRRPGRRHRPRREPAQQLSAGSGQLWQLIRPVASGRDAARRRPARGPPPSQGVLAEQDPQAFGPVSRRGR